MRLEGLSRNRTLAVLVALSMMITMAGSVAATPAPSPEDPPSPEETPAPVGPQDDGPLPDEVRFPPGSIEDCDGVAGGSYSANETEFLFQVKPHGHGEYEGAAVWVDYPSSGSIGAWVGYDADCTKGIIQP